MKKILLLITIFLLSCQSRNLELSLKYKEDALHDIKVDSVKVFTFGFPIISPIESERKIQETKNNKIINLYEKYGLYRINLGCVLNTKEEKSRKIYHKTTAVYLEKRNGKGWKKKLDREIETLLYK